MKLIRARLQPIPRTVLTVVALAAALHSSTLLAQSVSNTFTPTVLVRFSGDNGSSIGGNPYAPPLLSPDGVFLRGTTLAGGPIYGIFNYTQSTVYQYTLGSGNYAASVLDMAYGHQFTNSVQDTNGTLRAGAAHVGSISSSTTTGVTFSLAADGSMALDALPDSTVVSAANFLPKGQIAMDGSGNVYFGSGNLVATCATGNPTSANSLWRLGADGTTRRVVNFCDFLVQSGVDSRNNPLYLHTKGGLPVALVWSEADQALYGMTQVASVAVDPSLPSTDNSGRSVGTLFKINKAALDTGVNAGNGAAIEVLHSFAQTRDGVPVVLATAVAADSRASGLVEDGDWLYGTTNYNSSNTAAAGGTLWRVHKTRANSFQVVHYFHSDTSKDGTSQADGANPMGPLVRAADGHIYGTTARDASSMSGVVATGAGTLFRIKVGTADDRADDQFELLHRFNATTDGARPVGLSLGANASGVQKLFGATRQGGTSSAVLGTSASSTTGSGTLFSVDVALPTVSFGSALSASVANARIGDSLTLSWAADNAARCVAGGDNGNTWTGAQQTSASQVPLSSTLNKLGVNTFTLVCESVNGGPAATSTVSVTVVTAAVSPTPPDTATTSNTPQGSGGGGGPLSLWLLVPLAALGLVRRQAHLMR